MLVTGSNSELTLSRNVGLTAFQIAVVQQKAFEETLERVSEKQSQVSEDIERRAEEAREARARERGGVDVVVREDDGKRSDAPDQDPAEQTAESSSGKLDVVV